MPERTANVGAASKGGGKELIEVVAVNCDENRRTVQRFLQRWGADLQMTVTRDYKRRARKSLDVDAIPAIYVFDTNGELENSHCGYSEEGFIRLVEDLNELIMREDAAAEVDDGS